MNASSWDIVVVGAINTDFVARGAELPTPGSSVTGDTFLAGPGGKGANHAVAAARLGARVALISRVGANDRGPGLVAALAATGVDTSHVERDREEPTGAALIHVGGSGEKQSLSAPGANRSLTISDVHAAATTIGRARVLLASLGVPLASVSEAVRLARQAGANVVLDPAPPVPLPDDLLRSVDVMKPNGHEAKVLTGILPRDRASARAAADRLLARGVAAVAVQAGGGDNLLVRGDGELWLPALPVEPVDVTGAGDAFAAALAVGLAEGWPLAAAGHFASATAALATTKLGAQPSLPDRAAVLALLARTGGVSRPRAEASEDALKSRA